MHALTVTPGRAGSLALDEMPEPPLSVGSMLVEAMSVGVCGTDVEIIAGQFGAAPPGETRLIIGHESLGRVISCPDDCGFAPGDLVAGIVRRPDPVPCRYCAAGEWDMCRNGQYTERGIKQRHGFASTRFRLEPEFAVNIDHRLGNAGVLLEPASIVAKAWEHAERIGQRTTAWRAESVLVTGAGPIGLLAALMGAQRGLEVHVFDRVRDGVKPELARALGATYHSGAIEALGHLDPDIVLECTGATPVIADVLTRSAPSGIVCLTGVSSGGHHIQLDLGAMNKQMVLENDAVFGSVNANRRHYEAAAECLRHAETAWLSRLITRRVPLVRWADAFQRQSDDVKVVIDFQSAA